MPNRGKIVLNGAASILPGAKITHKGDDHIRTQTQEASVKTTSQISIYWAIG